MRNRTALMTAAQAIAFAGAAAPAPAAPKANVTPAASKTAAATAAERVAPVITSISTSIPLPVIKSKRGSASAYPFDKLTEVGASFGVTNKTAKQLAAIVANANRKALVDKVDADGNKVFKTNEMKDAAGNVTQVPTSEVEQVAGKHFVVVDTDPATDPEKATARVFRDK